MCWVALRTGSSVQLRSRTHCAKVNVNGKSQLRGSIRVLQKRGFVVCDEASAFAEARGQEVEEFVFRLDSACADATLSNDLIKR